jgi:hypothetical protein
MALNDSPMSAVQGYFKYSFKFNGFDTEPYEVGVKGPFETESTECFTQAVISCFLSAIKKQVSNPLT